MNTPLLDVVAGAALALTAAAAGQPAGDLLVGDFNGAQNILRYDLDGDIVGVFVFSGVLGMAGPHAMVYGPDGNGDGRDDLYVTSTNSSAILRFDGRTGAAIDIFGSAGVFTPVDVNFDVDRSGDGVPDLHVVNFDGPNQVVWFNGATGAPGAVLVSGNPNGLFNPEFLEFGPDLDGDGVPEFYVTAMNQPSIWEFDGATGAFTRFIESGGGNGFVDGREMAYHTDGLLYVCNGGGDSIVRYDPVAGDFVDVFVPAGTGGLDNPHWLIFGPDASGDGIEDLYVAGVFSGTVSRHDAATGGLIDVMVTPGEGGVTGPATLAFLPPPCVADLNDDGEVGIVDFLALLAAWGPNPGDPADLDGDGVVGILDFLALLAAWGPCP